MSDFPPVPPPPPQQPTSPQPAPPSPPPSPYTMPVAPSAGAGAPPPPGFGLPGSGPSFGGSSFPSAPKRSGKAVAALVLGIVGVLLCFLAIPAILAIVFGVLAMREIKRSAGTRSGRGMAIAGLVLGVVGLLVAVAFWLIVAFGIANSSDVFDLEVGDCVELPDRDTEEVSRLQTFDCTEAHGAEVFAVGELDGGDEPYPGVDEVQAMIEAECRPAFEEYVGVPFETSELEATTIYPQEEDWDRTQNFVCLAFSSDGDLTESIKDSGR